jgi:hypothetical protein
LLYPSQLCFNSFIHDFLFCFISLQISFEASDITTIMKSKSSTMNTVCNFSLLSLDFFRDVSFVGEIFLFLDVSSSSRGFLGGVTSPCFCLYSFPLSSSLSTLSSPPTLGDSEVVSSDALLSSCIYSFFFLLLLPGVSDSLPVTTELPIRLGSDIFVRSKGIRSSAGHSLHTSSRSSSMIL